MKTLILGSNGQLGRALAETAPDGTEYIGLDLPELDITNADTLLEICQQVQPSVIINASAYTAVDQAESETALAAAVNVEGPRNAAAAAIDIGARLIHISTDFVFDGKSSTPYKADAATNPLNVYGRTKREGELAVLQAMPDTSVIVRTAWLYSQNGSNFVKTMLMLMGERDEISVVADQFGTPTWADSLAKAIWAFTELPELGGIHHWTDAGEATWQEFAVAIQEEALSLGILSRAIPIHGIGTVDYPAAAIRPPYSVLNCSATYLAIRKQPAHWRENLHQMLKGLKAKAAC